jgi:hypothetical protein
MQGGPLRLRHASKRPSGTWGAGDYNVMSGDHIVGRILKNHSAPKDKPWMWAITGVVIMCQFDILRCTPKARSSHIEAYPALAK